MALDLDGEGTELFIDGTKTDTWNELEVEKRLNEVDTFEFVFYDTEDGVEITQGRDILVFEDGDFVFKGRIENTDADNRYEIRAEGEGMAAKLLDRKTDRDDFNNTPADEIVESLVPTETVELGTIDPAPTTSLNFDHDNVARAVAGAANAVGYDWVLRQDSDDDYETDYIDFEERIGSSSAVETFTLGDNARFVSDETEDGFLANDITLLGRGDGVNQLEVRVWAAAEEFTQLDGEISEDENSSFTVDDTSVLGSTDDDVLVKVGTEIIDATIDDSTALSINERGVEDFRGDETDVITHRDNISVWLYENKTTGDGPYTPENRSSAETGSSIESNGVKQLRETDKTIVKLPTLEQVADRELRNRYKDVKSIRIRPSVDEIGGAVSLGDEIEVVDEQGTGLSDEFRVVGIDFSRRVSGQGTELVCANRPRRLVERLSEVERDRDTLNAHMQGATNFNSESFGDNCDEDNPLRNNFYVPDDVVQINKFEVTFTRDSFRGYVQNQPHSHGFDIDIPDHDHDFSIDIPDHSHDFPSVVAAEIEFGSALDTIETISNDLGTGEGDLEISGLTGFVETQSVSSGSAGDDDHQHGWPTSDSLPFTFSVDFGGSDLEHRHQWPDTTQSDTTVITNIDFSYEGLSSVADGGGEFISTSTDDGGGTFESETTDSAGEPEYGIFEPDTEPDVDVEVRVDGTLVDTITDVSVGEEVDTPISIAEDLDEPITGKYHTVELKPVDTGGGNNGRTRLQANVVQKVFIESTL